MYLDKNDPNVIYDEITTIDNALTRPWVVTRNTSVRLSVVWFEQTVRRTTISPDRQGKLFPRRRRPVDADQEEQPPPDLKYFNLPRGEQPCATRLDRRFRLAAH